MSCKFINLLAFAAGAAIGSAVTWRFVKKRYERLVQEEVESVKEVFAEMMADKQNYEPTNEPEVSDEEKVAEPRQAARQINWSELEDLDPSELEDDPTEYEQLVRNYTSEKGGGEDMAKKPYVISPYDFDTIDDYKIVELTYYTDDILEDEYGNIVEDIEELIGPDALTAFGEYEDDAVFVRNDYLETDIQILKDYRTYEEARSINGPRRVYDE